MNYSQLANSRILEQPTYQPGKPIEVVAREQGFKPHDLEFAENFKHIDIDEFLKIHTLSREI